MQFQNIIQNNNNYHNSSIAPSKGWFGEKGRIDQKEGIKGRISLVPHAVGCVQNKKHHFVVDDSDDDGDDGDDDDVDDRWQSPLTVIMPIRL